MTLSVTLVRDGPGTAWGFRLHGGRDLGLPLTVQRVALGSPSEGELRVGDILVAIAGKDATKMSHQSATDCIKKSGSQLPLVVHRVGGYQRQPLSPVATLPRSPLGLPTTKLPRGAPYTPEAYLTQEQYEYLVEKEREKQAIVSQPFRSTPLILPQGRPRHDIPVGSYLRHEQARQARAATESLRAASADSALAAKLQEAVAGNRTLLRQYNSPLRLYSPANVEQALADQTGIVMSPQLTLRDTIKDMILGAASSISSGRSNTNSPLPRFQPSPTHARLYSQEDLTKSPTYQAILEEEWAALQRGEVREHRPVESVVHDVHSEIRPRDQLAQSLSFKNLMHNLYCTRPVGADL